MSELQIVPDWECREGYTNWRALNAGNLMVASVVYLQTDAPTQEPITELKIVGSMETPSVIIVREDGLNVGPPSVTLAGSCSYEVWHNRSGIWPASWHKGLIVPGEHLLFSIREKPQYLKYRVLGWKIVEGGISKQLREDATDYADQS